MFVPESLKNFYVLVKEYSVVAYSSNFKYFYEEVIKLEAIKEELPSDSTIKRRLANKDDKLVVLGKDGKIYTLQKIV